MCTFNSPLESIKTVETDINVVRQITLMTRSLKKSYLLDCWTLANIFIIGNRTVSTAKKKKNTKETET